VGRPGAKRPLWRPVRQPPQALKYALFENGHHPETIIELSHEIELNMRYSHGPRSTGAAGVPGSLDF
jgi:hypothetical protein